MARVAEPPGPGRSPIAASAAPPANTSLRPRRRDHQNMPPPTSTPTPATEAATGTGRSSRRSGSSGSAGNVGSPTDSIDPPIVIPSPGSSGSITAR